MANLELITGHGESDHISSFDMRASNRATFGKGKYILTDAENMNTTVVVSDKMLSISPGSCLWSGMHIRNEGVINVPFVSPASTDSVYFWLHYTRDVSTLVERVEIVSTTSSTMSADLIYNELPDGVTEAYTLFYSFTFNPNGNVVTNTKKEFTLIKGMNDFFVESTEKLNTQAAENAQKLNELSNEFNGIIADYEENMLNTVYDVTELGKVYFGSPNTSATVDLLESATKFKMLVIFVSGWSLGFINPAISQQTRMSRVDIGSDEKLWINYITCSLQSDNTSVTISGKSAQFFRDSLGYKQNVYDYPDSGHIMIKIYGIGRVAE